MLSITRYHDISAGHRVVGHEGKCLHIHGHNYRIHFTVAGSQDEVGRIIDFGVIKSALCEWLENNWDHRMLLWVSDPWLERIKAIDPTVAILPFNPTAENMAQYLVNVVGPEILKDEPVTLIEVSIEETRKCSATFRKE